MTTRTGRALRDKMAADARYAADPAYYARHWAAGERRAYIIRRYAEMLLDTGMSPEEVMPLLMAAQDRVRVVEQDRQFRVTAKP